MALILRKGNIEPEKTRAFERESGQAQGLPR